MSSTSYDLKDESCVTMKDKEESERVASWIKKATREGCHVFIPPPPHLRRDCWKEREEEIDRKLKEEENERKKKDHHHNYRYKLYKNYFHILSFLHSFIYSIISTFIILLFTNKWSRGLWAGRKFLYAWSIPIIFLPIIIFFSARDEKEFRIPSDIHPLNDGNGTGINGTTVLVAKMKEEIVWLPKAAGCGYVLLVMSFYWLLEAVPMAITALLPVVFFPLLGILSSSDTCAAYMKETVMIFLGSLVAAAAVEESNLHQRIALKVLLLFGTSPQWLLLGFMTNTMFLSMWISNTAATALMIPIVDAVLMQLRFGRRQTRASLKIPTDMPDAIRMENLMKKRTSLVRPRFSSQGEDPDEQEDGFDKLRKSIYLGICYSANIGGTGTLTGTGTNLILYGMAAKYLSFSSWMIFAVPGMLICVFLAWAFITLVYVRKNRSASSGTSPSAITNLIRSKYNELGSMSFQEHAVLWLFICLILLWFFRSPQFITGWADVILPGADPSFVKDSAPAIFIVLLYYMIPAKPRQIATSKPLMTWKSTQDKVAWNVVLLLGGGFALSKGAQQSGLSSILGYGLKQQLAGVSVFGIQLATCLLALVMTEVASNATTATILLAVVDNVAQSMKIAPLQLMVPLTLCCSWAFLLPVASPPNAIIFEAGDMKTKDMVIPGIIMKIVCLCITLLMVTVWGGVALDFTTLGSGVSGVVDH